MKIELRNINKTYKSKAGKDMTAALRDVSLEIAGPQMVFIVGKSGGGKSTLLNILGGIDTPDSGDILIDGVPMSGMPEEYFDNYRNTRAGFIFQEYNLLDEMNIEDNISLALRMQGERASADRVNAVLSKLELTGYNKRLVDELSGGQKQRVAIARALIKDPSVILADEPTGALDSETGKQILAILKDISKEKLVVVVSHDREYAEQYADRIIEISDGKIISDATKNLRAADTQDLQPIDKKRTLKTREAFKIGISGMRNNRGRLTTAMALMVLSLMLIGMASSFLTFDPAYLLYKNMRETNSRFLTYTADNSKYSEKHGMDISYSEHFSESDLTELGKKINAGIQPLFTDERLYIRFSRVDAEYVYQSHLIYESNDLMELADGLMRKLDFTLAAGRLPAADDEIVISRLFYLYYNHGGFYESGIYKEINKYEDLLGKTVGPYGNYKIVGILDTRFDEERYLPLLFSKGAWQGWENDALSRKHNEMAALFENGPHYLIYVNPGYYERCFKSEVLKNTRKTGDIYEGMEIYSNNEYLIDVPHISKLGAYPNIPKRVGAEGYDPPLTVYWKDGVSRENLSGNEVLLSLDKLLSFDDTYRNRDSVWLMRDEVETVVRAFAEENKADYTNVYYPGNASMYTSYILNNKGRDNIYNPGKNYDYFYKLVMDSFIARFSSMPQLKMQLCLSDCYEDITIAGVYLMPNHYDGVKYYDYINYDTVYLSDDYYGYLSDVCDLDGYTKLAVILNGDSGDLKTVRFLDENRNYSSSNTFYLHNDISYSIREAGDILGLLSVIFSAVAVVMIIFAILITYNYISVSISIKRKEIGIMRALGARKKDVFNIFYAKSLLIAFISAAAALIGGLILTICINQFLIRGYFQYNFSVLSYGWLAVLAIIGLSFITVTVSSIIPILRFVKNKPVDIIKNL